MKKLTAALLVSAAAFIAEPASAANCFWFGGTGNINDTSKWFAATNGGGGACTASGGWPNSAADNGTFDGNSGGGTITRNVNWTIGSLTVSAFAGTFGNSGDTASVQFNSFINNGSATRTFNMGASTWTCGSSGAVCVWQISGATNLTLNGNSSSLFLYSGGASGSVGGGTGLCWFGTGFSYNNVTFNPSNVPIGTSIGYSCNTGNTTFANLTIGSPNSIEFQGGSNWTITGTLDFSGGTPSATSLLFLYPDAPGTVQTFTLSGGPATCNWCSLRGITAATNSITANNSANLGRLTNITVNTPSPAGGGGGGSGNRIIGSF